MKKLTLLTASIVFLLAIAIVPSVTTVPLAAEPAGKVFVSNSDDSGPGSFRDAIGRASADPAIARVQFLGSVSVVELFSTVSFTGIQDLTIDGNGAAIDGANTGGTAFLATGGGNLTVSNLTVRNSPGEGIAVDVPTTATGTIRVSLFQVNVVDNDGHGVLVDDQDDPGTGELDGDSDASVEITVVNSRFVSNGDENIDAPFSPSDRDGLRVNEGGDGDLIVAIKNSLAAGNGADGIELDERGAGDVRVDMFNADVLENGRHDPSDLDDGFDIDESDGGSILGVIAFSSAVDNHEEGFDFNENHAGDLRVNMRHVEASGNGEEGIDYEEDDDFAGGGDLVTTMEHVVANGNLDGDAGLKIREKGEGHLDAALDHIEASGNDTSGIHVREDAAGNLVSSLTRAASTGNDGDGIEFDENGGGNLTAAASKSVSSNNSDSGIHAEQQTAGDGTLTLSKVALEGNGDAWTTGGTVSVIEAP